MVDIINSKKCIKFSSLDEFKSIDCPYIKRAFEYSYNTTMLSIRDFIKLTDFPIDKFMVDNFYLNLDKKIPIYVTNELIEWCGFNSKEFNNRKMEFNKILKKFEENKDYWYYTNKEYENYFEKLMLNITSLENNTTYPDPLIFKGKNKTKHIIITVNCFKHILLMLKTKKAVDIRNYYFALEELILIYIKYQAYQEKFIRRILEISHKEVMGLNEGLKKSIVELNESINNLKMEIECKNEVLDKLNATLDIAREDRLRRIQTPSKQDKFMIVKLNKPGYQWLYYAIRGQNSYIKKILEWIKGKYPNYEELITISSYYINSINFYKLLKKKLKEENKLITNGNEMKLTDGYSEIEFLKYIQDLNFSKKEIHPEDEKEEC